MSIRYIPKALINDLVTKMHVFSGEGRGGCSEDWDPHLRPQQGVHLPRHPHRHPAQQQGRGHSQEGGRGQ